MKKIVGAEFALPGGLISGERVLWRGVPVRGLRFEAADWARVPFALLWTGFAFSWEYRAVTMRGAPVFFPVWGIPFCVIGVYVTVGRFAVDAVVRAVTVYVLTNQRVLVVRSAFGHRVQSVQLDSESIVEFVDEGGGRGTILFGFQLHTRSAPRVPRFEGIEDAERVFRRIEEIRAARAA